MLALITPHPCAYIVPPPLDFPCILRQSRLYAAEQTAVGIWYTANHGEGRLAPLLLVMLNGIWCAFSLGVERKQRPQAGRNGETVNATPFPSFFSPTVSTSRFSTTRNHGSRTEDRTVTYRSRLGWMRKVKANCATVL